MYQPGNPLQPATSSAPFSTPSDLSIPPTPHPHPAAHPPPFDLSTPPPSLFIPPASRTPILLHTCLTSLAVWFLPASCWGAFGNAQETHTLLGGHFLCTLWHFSPWLLVSSVASNALFLLRNFTQTIGRVLCRLFLFSIQLKTTVPTRFPMLAWGFPLLSYVVDFTQRRNFCLFYPYIPANSLAWLSRITVPPSHCSWSLHTRT